MLDFWVIWKKGQKGQKREYYLFRRTFAAELRFELARDIYSINSIRFVLDQERYLGRRRRRRRSVLFLIDIDIDI